MNKENLGTLTLPRGYGRWSIFPNLFFCAILLFSGCEKMPKGVNWPLYDQSPRDRYITSLRKAKLTNSLIYKTWMYAGEQVVMQNLLPALPHHERLYFDARTPSAAGFNLSLKEGQKIEVVAITNPSQIQVFIDLYKTEGQVGPDTISLDNNLTKLQSAKWSGDTLFSEIQKTGTYLIRVQPELMAECETEISIRLHSTYQFPVEGRGNKNIGSFFGDPRDGGRRKHKGIDIFAKRGTPILAIGKGHVTSVREGGLGGKTVWIRDSKRGLNQYYAHLDEQLVKNGSAVNIGDTIGTVGNTGNARTTPSHLHFGLYAHGRGAVDPMPFIYQHLKDVPKIPNDNSWFDHPCIVINHKGKLKAGPSHRERTIITLAKHQLLSVVGVCKNYLRVSLPNGLSGYVNTNHIHKANKPILTFTIENSHTIWNKAWGSRIVKSKLSVGHQIQVFGKSGEMTFIHTTTGMQGWVDLHQNKTG